MKKHHKTVSLLFIYSVFETEYEEGRWEQIWNSVFLFWLL